MESKLNADIREVLEKFGVDTTKVIGEWNIIGHLVNAAKKNGAKQWPLKRNHRRGYEQNKRLDKILKLLQAKDFYDAIGAVEMLGASEDFTKAVVAIGNLQREQGIGYQVASLSEVKAHLQKFIEEMGTDLVTIDPDNEGTEDHPDVTDPEDKS